MSELIYQVYGLKEPDTEKIRYIGITKNRLKDRLRQHVGDKNRKHKTNWVGSLKQRGLRPEIELLEDGLTFEQAVKKEVEYIKLFKSFGANLVNSTLGGEGTVGWKMSDEHKEIMRQKAIAGIDQLHEYRKLSNEKLRGVPRTDEVKRKVSLGLTGLIRTEESKKKQGDAIRGEKNHFFGKKLSAESIAKGNLKRALKPIIQYDLIGNEVGRFESLRHMMRETGFSRVNVSRSLKDETKTAMGFKWKYAK